MSARPKLKGLAQVALASAEPRELANFYRDTLGLEQVLETSDMTFFDAGGARLMIGPSPTDPAMPGDTILYFEPEDFAAYERDLETRGVTFAAPTQLLQKDGERELVLRPFKDPAGHVIALMGWRWTG